MMLPSRRFWRWAKRLQKLTSHARGCDTGEGGLVAALAYYSFLAIPSALMIAVGAFGLLAGPNAVTTVIGKAARGRPGQATSLLEGSLKTLTQHKGTSITVLSLGGALANPAPKSRLGSHSPFSHLECGPDQHADA